MKDSAKTKEPLIKTTLKPNEFKDSSIAEILRKTRQKQVQIP